MKYAMGKFINSKEVNGKPTTPRITVSVQSKSREEEARISKSYARKGFVTGDAFKNEKGNVYLPGTFWVNKSVLGDKTLNESVASRLDGKMVFLEDGYLKGIDKASFNNIFNISKNSEGKEIVNITGNLHVSEKDSKKSIFISNSVVLETKEGKEWSENAIKNAQEKLTALNLSSRVNEYEGKKYLNVSKNIFGASTSVLSDEKLLAKIAKEKPFVVVSEPLFRYIEGGSLLIDKNNSITPLGEKSEAVFKSVDKLLTKLEKKENLYATEEQEEAVETKKTAKKEAVKVVKEEPKAETKKSTAKVEKPKAESKKTKAESLYDSEPSL